MIAARISMVVAFMLFGLTAGTVRLLVDDERAAAPANTNSPATVTIETDSAPPDAALGSATPQSALSLEAKVAGSPETNVSSQPLFEPGGDATDPVVEQLAEIRANMNSQGLGLETLTATLDGERQFKESLAQLALESPYSGQIQIDGGNASELIERNVAETDAKESRSPELDINVTLQDPVKIAAANAEPNQSDASTPVPLFDEITQTNGEMGQYAPVPSHDPAVVTPSVSVARKLRNFARRLDEMAFELEEESLYEHADALREHAQAMRLEAREQSVPQTGSLETQARR